MVRTLSQGQNPDPLTPDQCPSALLCGVGQGHGHVCGGQWSRRSCLGPQKLKEVHRVQHAHPGGKPRLGEGKADSLVPHCLARFSLQALPRCIRREPLVLSVPCKIPYSPGPRPPEAQKPRITLRCSLCLSLCLCPRLESRDLSSLSGPTCQESHLQKLTGVDTAPPCLASGLGAMASQARERGGRLLWKGRTQKLGKSDGPREAPSSWGHGWGPGSTLQLMQTSSLLELEKSVPPCTPSLSPPESPHSQEPGWSPAGSTGHDITCHHGSGSGGLAAGVGHTWVKLGGREGEQSAGELGAEAGGGWSQRETNMLVDHHLILH